MNMDMYGNSDTPELTNQQKAAVLFIALGPEYSAMLFKHMNDDEIEKGVQFYQNLANFHCVNEYGCVALGVKVIESKL